MVFMSSLRSVVICFLLFEILIAALPCKNNQGE